MVAQSRCNRAAYEVRALVFPSIPSLSAVSSEIVPLESVVYHTSILVDFWGKYYTIAGDCFGFVVIFSVLCFQKIAVSNLFFVFQIQNVPIMKHPYDN